MNGQVVAFSGPIGSRKAELSRAVAGKLNWPWRSFGDRLREIAKSYGLDANDRFVLQQLGQSKVQANPNGFVAEVLSGHDWRADPNLILNGLRHAEIRYALLLYLREVDVGLKVVFVDIDETLRQRRAEERGMPLRMLATYDRDLTEAQVGKVIRAYADVIVPGTLPDDIAVDNIVSKLNLQAPPKRSTAHG